MPVGRTPAAIAASDDAVWLVDADARTLVRFDAEGNTVETLATGSTPTDVVVGRGAVWVANGGPLPAAQFIGPVATAVTRVDPATRTERARVELPPPRGAVSNLVENHLAVHRGAIWAVTPDFSLARIDTETARSPSRPTVPRRGRRRRRRGSLGARASTGPRAARAPLGRVSDACASPSPLGAIAVGEDAAWVTSPGDGDAVARPSRSAGALSPIQLGTGHGRRRRRSGVWVVNPLRGAARSSSPAPARSCAGSRSGDARAVAVDGSRSGSRPRRGPTTELRARSNGERDASVEQVRAGLRGRRACADVLVVSDLPLQGGIRSRRPQMAQAITFVLRERGFRAGRFRVAYQSCDDSIGSTGLYDEAKCEANAGPTRRTRM